jgi:hypothetical protein
METKECLEGQGMAGHGMAWHGMAGQGRAAKEGRSYRAAHWYAS